MVRITFSESQSPPDYRVLLESKMIMHLEMFCKILSVVQLEMLLHRDGRLWGVNGAS